MNTSIFLPSETLSVYEFNRWNTKISFRIEHFNVTKNVANKFRILFYKQDKSNEEKERMRRQQQIQSIANKHDD